MKCYKLVFNINSITKNYGSIFALIYFLLYLCFLIAFVFKGIYPLKVNAAKNFIDMQDNIALNNNNKTVLNRKTTLKINKNKNKNKKKKPHNNSKRKKFSKFNKKSNPPKKKKMLNKKQIKINQHNNKNIKKIINKTNIKIIFNKYENQTKNNIESSKRRIIETAKSIKKNDFNFFNNDPTYYNEQKEEKKLDNFELGELEYFEAIELDKRQFHQIYWAILMREHLVLFTFFSCNDYNIIYVKFARFIFLVCTDMAMNVFFFTDESMHKIYLNYGKYNFIQQIPQIIYSTALSQLLELFLCYLSLTDKHIYKILELKKKKVKDDIFNILKCIKIKLIAFFSFIFVFFIFYWYLISCFCAVYENTQIIFIKDSVSSFFTSCIYQFVIYLVPSVLRVIALKDKKKNRKCIYKLSDIIPFF